MSKLKQDKIPMTLTNDGKLTIADELKDLAGLFTQEQSKLVWKLVRQHDGLTKSSAEVTWIEWDENGRYKARHDAPGQGRSLLMSPFNDFFTWQTTSVTEILACTPECGYVKFKTKNSIYELSKQQ
jgi:YD repeat-containing protein